MYKPSPGTNARESSHFLNLGFFHRLDCRFVDHVPVLVDIFASDLLGTIATDFGGDAGTFAGLRGSQRGCLGGVVVVLFAPATDPDRQDARRDVQEKARDHKAGSGANANGVHTAGTSSDAARRELADVGRSGHERQERKHGRDNLQNAHRPHAAGLEDKAGRRQEQKEGDRAADAAENAKHGTRLDGGRPALRVRVAIEFCIVQHQREALGTLIVVQLDAHEGCVTCTPGQHSKGLHRREDGHQREDLRQNGAVSLGIRAAGKQSEPKKQQVGWCQCILRTVHGAAASSNIMHRR